MPTQRSTATNLFCVPIQRGVAAQPQALQGGLVSAQEQRVKNVEVALARCLQHNTRLLQQIVEDAAADGLALLMGECADRGGKTVGARVVA